MKVVEATAKDRMRRCGKDMSTKSAPPDRSCALMLSLEQAFCGSDIR